MGCEREKRGQKSKPRGEREQGTWERGGEGPPEREAGHDQICAYRVRVPESFHAGCIAWLTPKGRR